ncbi:hypothetical protein GOP47_0018336 [Adiantum capillus-veneris]|uniref:DUF4408 domain-containing protein n=1 Tax=Adiantum capillus-veneris TaxID=13818 RepID=A0A9D4ZA12_ADICA|nr:hypothetical protein GOP47_0018336 [Adiantum capillus-veneris]
MRRSRLVLTRFVMGVAKPLVLCSLIGLCILAVFSLRSATIFHYFSALRSWAPWPAELEANLTPPLLFLLLNLLLATLLVTNTGFLRRSIKNESEQESDGTFHLQAAIERISIRSSRKKATQATSILESSTRGPLQAPAKQLSMNVKHLNRSKSDKAAMAAASSAAESTLTALAQAAPQMKPSLDPISARKKKKRRSASSGFEEANPMKQSSNEGLRKAQSVPQEKNKTGDGDDAEAHDEDEVNRRAEDFISKFYMQMRMQRLASLERYHQRLDRSYGR